MAKRVCIFVDGENLRHAIGDLFSRAQFDPRDYLPEQADWTGFFDDLVFRATGGNGERIRAYWYVVQQVDPFPVSALGSGRIPRRQVSLALGNRLMCESLGIETQGDLAAKADQIKGIIYESAIFCLKPPRKIATLECQDRGSDDPYSTRKERPRRHQLGQAHAHVPDR